jgi:hypothetical protein
MGVTQSAQLTEATADTAPLGATCGDADAS